MRILMVCHGNICRSTMAEYVMRHLVAQQGLDKQIQVDSAAATSDAVGWGVHWKTQQVLEHHHIPCGNHRAWQMTQADYERYDLICGMDEENLADIYHILANDSQPGWRRQRQAKANAAVADPQGKVHLLLDWSSRPREIDDPWYTDDFEAAYRDISEGCQTLLAHLMSEGLS